MYKTAVDTELQLKVDILKLITLVKKYPCIFDPQESGYTCSKINNIVWKKIDEEMGVPNPTSKKVWYSLRTTHLAFRAYEQRLANTSGPGCPVPWQWEKEMSFIDEYEDDDSSTLSGYGEQYYETKGLPEEQEDFSQYRLDDDKLIECIKNYPILIEIFSDNIKEKNAAWNAIAEKMGNSVKCCQYWWKKLEKRYRKELWYHKKGISSNWEHFHKMDFAKVYVSFNIGNTSSLKEQSAVIFRYFNKLGKFLEKAPKEKRAELDDQILNLLLNAELNSYSSVPKEDLQEDPIEVLNSSQGNLSENVTTGILDNVQPTNKYIVKIVPDGETSLENISEEYEINFLPDDLNIDAPLIDCQMEEPAEVKKQVQNGEIKEEPEDVEIKEELEAEEIKVETKEEVESVEGKEEEQNVQKQEVAKLETNEEIENVAVQKVKHVEEQEEAENMEIQQEVETMKAREEIERSEVKEEVESMEVKEEVETEIKEETEEADILKVLEEEDEEMVGCYVIEVTDE